jgi:hypothetical protein
MGAVSLSSRHLLLHGIQFEARRLIMNAEILKRICHLQPHYSPTNTHEMKERGKLIRDALADQLRGMLPRISAVIGDAAKDLSVDSSDGIGRNTEAPRVQVHSESLSPNH